MNVSDGVSGRPAVAMDAEGNFVVASSGPGLADRGGILRWYAANGAARTGDVRVDIAAQERIFPDVAMDWVGNAVVTWSRRGPDGQGQDVYARRFDAPGRADGPPQRVNTHLPGDQGGSAVAVGADGGAVIVWSSQDQDGSGLGVYGRRLQLSRPPLAEPDAFFVAEGEELTVSAPGVLLNDKDPDGGLGLRAELVSGPTNGILTLHPDGSFSYRPAAGFRGADRFTYRAARGRATGTAATVTLSVGVGTRAGLALRQADTPDPVPLGRPLTYTLTVNNAGPEAATAVTLTDTLPPSVGFRSALASQGACLRAGPRVTCDLGILPAGASANVQIVVTPGASGLITNSAAVRAAQVDPTPANNLATQRTTVAGPPTGPARANLKVEQTAAPIVAVAGRPLVYAVTISNRGPDPATDVRLVDTLPTGVTVESAWSGQGAACARAGRVVTCRLGTLATGSSARVLIVATPGAAGSLANEARATAAEADPDPSNNRSTRRTTVRGGR